MKFIFLLSALILCPSLIANPFGPGGSDPSGIFSKNSSSGSGISSLNGLTGSTQTFAVSTSGTNFTVSSSGTVHTFNLPTASASNRGAVSAADWSTFNAKAPTANPTFTGVALFDDGLVGAPGIAWSASPTTGIYRIGTDATAFSAAGVYAGQIMANGTLLWGDTAYPQFAKGGVGVNYIVAPSAVASAATTSRHYMISDTVNTANLNIGVYGGSRRGMSSTNSVTETLPGYTGGYFEAVFSPGSGNTYTNTLAWSGTGLITAGVTGVMPRVTGAGTIALTHAAAIHATGSATNTGTNKYGVLIDTISGATNNYSIYTGTAGSFFGGAVTVPDGAAATPGIRLTSEATGLYSAGAGKLGFSLAGRLTWRMYDNAGYASLLGYPTSTSQDVIIGVGATDNKIYLTGDTGNNSGGAIGLYGTTHATKANYTEFESNGSVSAAVNGTGQWVFGATTDLSSSNKVSIVGGSALTGNSQIGLSVSTVFNSSATTLGYGIKVAPATAASSFTQAIMAGLYAATPTIGSGSTVTRYTNFMADQVSSGPTNSAVLADNASYTGYWFINQANSNASQFKGSVTIYGTSANLTLRGDSNSSAGKAVFSNPASSGHYNWLLSAQNNLNNAFEITPSTATDGSTFSTPVFSITNAGAAAITGSLTVGAAIQIADGTASVPSLALNSDVDGSGTGFYRGGTNIIGVTNNGAQSLAFEADLIRGYTATATDPWTIARGSTTGSTAIYGGSSTSAGKLELFAASHGSLPSYFRLSTGTVARLAGDATGHLAVNSNTTNTDQTLYVHTSDSYTGTSNYGVYTDPTFPSGATGSGSTYFAQPRTAASSFTMARLSAFEAGAAVIGATSTVTRLINFYSTAPTAGTNNANFADNVTFTGNYFIHQSGTTASSFGGTVTMANIIDTGATVSTVAVFDGSKQFASSAVTSTQLAGFLVEQTTGNILTPTDTTYTLDQYAEYAYTINRITTKMTSGTATMKLQIDGVDVTGCTGIALSSSEVQTTCSAANVVSVGNTVTMVVSSSSTPVGYAFTEKKTRN